MSNISLLCYKFQQAPKLHTVFTKLYLHIPGMYISFIFLLQERLKEMKTLVVKYLKGRYSAGWKELTAETAERFVTASENSQYST